MATALKVPAVDTSTFHGRLHMIRAELGFSQARMARELDVPYATYRTHEGGAAPHMGRETYARRIRDRFGYDDGWLLYGDDSHSKLRGRGSNSQPTGSRRMSHTPDIGPITAHATHSELEEHVHAA